MTERIETFLLNGEIKKPRRKSKKKPLTITPNELNLETVITEGHRCSQDVRAFFKSVIGPKFHFTTYIQNFFKDNIGKTYLDAVEALLEEEKRKKLPTFKKDITLQFEYYLFIRNYFADPSNKGKNRKEAIKAWSSLKKLPGKQQI